MAAAGIRGPSVFSFITVLLISHLPVSSTNSMSIQDTATDSIIAASTVPLHPTSTFISEPESTTDRNNPASIISLHPTSTSTFQDEATVFSITPTSTQNVVSVTDSSVTGNIQSSDLEATDSKASVINTMMTSSVTMASSLESNENKISSSDSILTTSVNIISSTSDLPSTDGTLLSASSNTEGMLSSSLSSLTQGTPSSSVIVGVTSASNQIDTSTSDIKEMSSTMTISSTSINPSVHLSSSLYPSESDAGMSSSTVTGPIDTQTSMAPTQTEMVSSSVINISPTSSSLLYSSELTSSSVVTSQAPPTTTTTPAPTTTDSQRKQVSVDENTVYKIKTEFQIASCDDFTTKAHLRSYILNIFKDVKEVRDVIVTLYPCLPKGRRKRNVEDNVWATLEIEAQANSTNATMDIIKAVNQDMNLNFTNQGGFEKDVSSAFKSVCNSTICDEYIGYLCEEKSVNAAVCINRCRNQKCSDRGMCKTIIDGSNSFATQCVCESEEYYKYEGETCEKKRMKWELAVAIAAGSGGAVILILIFILIVCCCCKKKGEKYEYRRQSYEQMSEVLGRPAYYRNEGIKSHQPGFTNLGYDEEKYSDISDQQLRSTNGQTWNPEESKDTYAKISQQFDQGNNFQIKRPQLSSKRESEPGEATTGF